MTLCVQRHCEEVAIAEAFPDCRRLARDSSSLCEVPSRLVLEDERDQQEAVFRGLLGPCLEEALRAAEPARCGPDGPLYARFIPIHVADRAARNVSARSA